MFIDHPVQKIMSRTGSFPLRVAYDLLKNYGKPNCTILDPFCGKGTSLFAARILGYNAVGIDIAAEASICSHAKMVEVELSSIIEYIFNLKVGKPSLSKVPSEVKIFFAKKTLIELIGVRNKLLRDMASSEYKVKNNAVFSLACLLGILHGHASYSLSIKSSHAYSMAPQYVKKYADRNNLHPPERDVKKCLVEKVKRSLMIPLPDAVKFKVKQGCASESSKLFEEYKNNIDIIFTSPPYLNAQTYAKDNWLRLWLLGIDYKVANKSYLQTGSIEKYKNKMVEVLSDFRRMLKPGGLLIIIAGDVKIKHQKNNAIIKSVFETGTFLAELVESNFQDINVKLITKHNVPSKLRYLHSLNSTNGHKNADIVERIIVAEKVRA